MHSCDVNTTVEQDSTINHPLIPDAIERELYMRAHEHAYTHARARAHAYGK